MHLIAWLQLKFNEVLAFFGSTEEELEDTSLVGQCEHLYRNFPVDRLTTYHQSKGIGVSVDALYHNIGQTVDVINQHLIAMEIHGNPLPEQCRYESVVVRFNKFILTKDGYYQPLQTSVIELREAVLRLCAKIRDGDKPGDITHPYTMRLLTPLLRHLVVLISIIEEVSER